MPTITSFAGEKLLAPATVAEIKNQTEILLKNKDVAGAFQAAAYLKMELAKLPTDKVKPVLDVYRAVSANLKVLSLPLLEEEEVKNLLANNLPFVDAAFSDALPLALAAWLSLQPETDKEKTKEELLAVLPAGSPLSEKIRAIVVSTPPAESAGGGRDPLYSGAPSTRGPSPSPAQGGLGIGTTMSGPQNAIKKDELFDDDEASELANHAAKVNEMGSSPLAVDGALTLAEEMLKQVQHDGGKVQGLPRTGFGDAESFKRRAQALIVSRLRDVRTTAEIREYLGRPFAVGGLGLSGDGLEKALKLIEQEYGRLHTAGPIKAVGKGSDDGEQGASQVSSIPPAPRLRGAGKNQESEGQHEDKIASSVVSEAVISPVIASEVQRSGTERSNLVANAMNVGIASSSSRSTSGGLPRNDKQEETDIVQVVKASAEPPSAAQAATPRVARPMQTSGSDKPRLDDIKHPVAERPSADVVQADIEPSRRDMSLAARRQGNIGSGTVGAPDELKLLTLSDFRSFGTAPAAINHILEKVNILAQESLSEKMTALAAFRESELFREYVNIGRAALGSGRKLAEVLADAALNLNKMTEDEFFAVAELNGKLR